MGVMTEAGRKLKDRVNSGRGEVALKFTRMACGSGRRAAEDDARKFQDLIHYELDMPLVECEVGGNGLTYVTGLLTNEGLDRTFDLYEVGVYAWDPDLDREILYHYVYSEMPDIVPPDTGRTVVNTRFRVITVTGETDNIVMDPGSLQYVDVETYREYIAYLESERGAGKIGYDGERWNSDADNVQDAIDELQELLALLRSGQGADHVGYDGSQWNINVTTVQEALDRLLEDVHSLGMHAIDLTLEHDMNDYPAVWVMEASGGYGRGGFGMGGYGGGGGQSLPVRVNYLNRNSLRVSVSRKYEGLPTVAPGEKLGEYLISFDEDEDASLYVKLIS